MFGRDKVKTEVLRKTENERMENTDQAIMNQRRHGILLTIHTLLTDKGQHYSATRSRVRHSRD